MPIKGLSLACYLLRFTVFANFSNCYFWNNCCILYVQYICIVITLNQIKSNQIKSKINHCDVYHTSLSVDFQGFSWQQGRGLWLITFELIMNTYFNLSPMLLICSDLIMVKFYCETFGNSYKSTLMWFWSVCKPHQLWSHKLFKGRCWFTSITEARMKWFKIMNNEIVTYTVMKNYVTGNWDSTFISLTELR